MADHAFRLVNVFAESRLAGNPLCVFENGADLDDATMQALALQFNLSETTFVLPSARATARIRIFTPTFEMPFAGHPVLGTAHVVRSLYGAGDRLTLETQIGMIPVEAEGDIWSLRAQTPKHRPPETTHEKLAAMLGLSREAVLPGALWVDTGVAQLIVPLATFDAVERAMPDATSMLRHASDGSRAMAYIFARQGDQVLARFFFLKHGAVIEDPGTGSACANLGGWLIASGTPLPQRLVIDQGRAVGRACRLGLAVTVDRQIRVSGRVIELGRGVVSL